MAQHLFPDNSVVVSFARADELNVLHQYLRGRGRVVEAVALEIRNSSGYIPSLAALDQIEWFGEPIPITGEKNAAAVEGIRVAVFGGARSKPREHLGESQTLHLLRSDPKYADSVWITEDREAYQFATRQRITTRDTFALLSEMVAYLDLTADRAFEVADRILDAGEPMLRKPTSPRDFIS